MHGAVGRARPDVPARGPSPPGDNQRTQRRSNSRTPRSPLAPLPAANTRVRSRRSALAGTRSSRQFRGPRESHAFPACALAGACGSPDPRPWSARMRHRAPPLPVHPLHCPGTGDARLPPPRVPSRPRAPEAALRLRVRGASAPGEAAPGGARAAASAPVTPVVGPPRPGPRPGTASVRPCQPRPHDTRRPSDVPCGVPRRGDRPGNPAP